MKMKDHKRRMKVRYNTLLLTCLFLIVFAGLLTGCFSRSKAPYLVDQYMLNYASPVPRDAGRPDEAIKIQRFSVAQEYNSLAMVYRPESFKRATYNYSRWMVNPGDMVTDYLIRDMEKAHIFRAVFSYRDSQLGRFLVDGGVTDFMEIDEGDAQKAVLGLNIILIDQNQTDITKRVLFQKTYRQEEPMTSRTPEALAQGASMAMQRLSEAVMNDISNAVKDLSCPCTE